MLKGACSDVISKVSAKVSAIPQAALYQSANKDKQNMAQVFDDFLDKDKRKNNIVVHNLMESEGNSFKEKTEQDIRLFQDMVKDVFHLNVVVARAFRAGKKIENKNRLLIVTLDTPGVKHDLLRLAPQLRGSEKWGRIYLTPDLTRTEREAARKLREELAARKAAGECNISIRKGKIVSLSGAATNNNAGPSSSLSPRVNSAEATANTSSTGGPQPTSNTGPHTNTSNMSSDLGTGAAVTLPSTSGDGHVHSSAQGRTVPDHRE